MFDSRAAEGARALCGARGAQHEAEGVCVAARECRDGVWALLAGAASVVWAGDVSGLAHRGRLLVEFELDARSGGRAQCLLGVVIEFVLLQTATAGARGKRANQAIRQEHMHGPRRQTQMGSMG